MKISRTRCTGDCPGRPQLACVVQNFTRRGSNAEVVISRIPANVCPICGHIFLEEETARRIESLLRPFHGVRGAIPSFPAAKIYIDFEEASSGQEAA
jgi:hypothetical protein